MANSRADAIRNAVDDAVHELPVTVWAARSFEDIRTRVRQMIGDATDEEVRGALASLESAGRVYRRPQTEAERQRDPHGWYGPGQTLAYEIREIDDGEGGLLLQLVVENQVTGKARVSRDVLHDMEATLGLERADVVRMLQRALAAHMTAQLAKVTVSNIRPSPDRELLFSGAYVYRDGDDVEAGAVWYDVPSGRTGPEPVPAVVRNSLRTEVHRVLTERDAGSETHTS